VSIAAWLALGVAAVLCVAMLRTRARLARLEERTRRFEQRVSIDLEPAIVEARTDAKRAAAIAHDAAVAAGVPQPVQRLPFETVTGPVVRAVAFGAGARRAIARVTAPPWARRGYRRSA
jgi:hypothetical protein